MKTCATCKHWERASMEQRCWWTERLLVGGTCTCPKVSEESGDMGYERDALVYSYQEGGTFWTGPDFAVSTTRRCRQSRRLRLREVLLPVCLVAPLVASS